MFIIYIVYAILNLTIEYLKWRQYIPSCYSIKCVNYIKRRHDSSKMVCLNTISHVPRINIQNNKLYLLDSGCDELYQFIRASVEREIVDFNGTTTYICFEYIKQNDSLLKFNNRHLFACITYTKDEDTPTFISRIDYSKYKYKMFKSENEIYINIPRKGTQIRIGKHDHLLSAINPEMLVIYIYDYKPNNAEVYISTNTDTNTDTNEYKFESEITHEINVKNRLNYKFFNELFYIHNHNFDFINSIFEKKSTMYKLSDTTGEQSIDIHLNELIYDKYSITNRFLNRYKEMNVLDKITRYWLLHELSPLTGINKSDEILNILSVEKTKNFILFLNSALIGNLVTDLYNLPSTHAIKIYFVTFTILSPGFINQEYKNLYSNFTADIMLDNDDKSANYSHIFNDDTGVKLNSGDLIIYNDKTIKHKQSVNGSSIMLTIKFGIINVAEHTINKQMINQQIINQKNRIF